MKKQATIYEKDGYTLRLARAEEADAYYEQNYHPLDVEVARLTGSRTNFTREEVTNFFKESVTSEECYLFLIIAPDGKLIGESVVNEIDWELRRANFRICIFHSADCGKGIGFWAVERTRDFAFDTLKLHRLELDVFSFNERARRTYEKAGFKQEGILRDSVKTENSYADDVLMAMLEDEWRRLYERKSL